MREKKCEAIYGVHSETFVVGRNYFICGCDANLCSNHAIMLEYESGEVEKCVKHGGAKKVKKNY